MISVLILTKNEEQDLPFCLESVKWCDDIHVFDSFSTDNTIEIALQAGALVTQRRFDGYASQRNAGLTGLVFKHDWLLILDADERVTDILVNEMRTSVTEAGPGVNGFRIQRKDFLYDRWLKHAQLTPFYIRLVKVGKARYHREINEVIQVDGVVLSLKNHFHHYPFSKGFRYWLEKHNQYSSMEAERWIEEHQKKIEFSWKKAFFSRDLSEKNYHRKGIYYKMPGRPAIKWLYMVIWKRAFLDGRAGLTYATLQSIYEYFIVVKTKELIHKIKK